MNWDDLLTVLALGIAGVMVGGVISLWRVNRFLSGVVAALALFVVIWGVLRLLPA